GCRHQVQCKPVNVCSAAHVLPGNQGGVEFVFAKIKIAELGRKDVIKIVTDQKFTCVSFIFAIQQADITAGIVKGLYEIRAGDMRTSFADAAADIETAVLSERKRACKQEWCRKNKGLQWVSSK